MTRFARTTIWTLLAALPLSGLACVPQDRYDQLLMSHRSMEEQLVAMESDRDAARANLETLRGQLTRTTVNINELQAQNLRLNTDLDRMAADYDELLRRVGEMDIGPLPIEVESAIERLAASHPDVLSFDARRGMLRFASDFTFDLGSVALKSEATQTLKALAEILNADTAREFEARIVGHTDNVRISRAETLRNHPTNVHLSVHRAISVRDALVNSGVNAARIQVAGYGQYRPVVPNRAGGTAENRRVEIFLVPLPADIQLADPAATATTSAPQQRPAPERTQSAPPASRRSAEVVPMK